MAEAPSADAALERLRESEFGVVLSDIKMPGKTGIEKVGELRRIRPETPVVLMTAFYYDQDHVIKRSRKEGLDGVLFKKPVNPERLVKTLAELITRASPRPS